VFDGRREKFLDFKKALRNKFREKGLESIAMNQNVRPLDIDEGEIYWMEPGQAEELERIKAKRRKSQLDWDEKNEKSYAILLNNLHVDISRQFDNIPQEGICHMSLTILEEKYGGEPDVEAIATYIKNAKDPLKANDTVEIFLSRFEYNHTLDGTNMNNGSALLALLKIVLGDNSRTAEALKIIRQRNLNWLEAKTCLITEDRAMEALNNGTKGVTFLDGKINAILDNDKTEKVRQEITHNNTNYNKRDNNINNNSRGRNLNPFNKNSNNNFRDRSRSRDRDKSRMKKQYHNKTNDTSKDKDNKEKSNNTNQRVCFNFRNTGHCNFGKDCRYLHESKICSYNESGNCKFGSKCKFQHNK
jgi:hypothetical protein